MKNFDTLRLKSAIKSRSNNDLSFSHLTTTNFGEALPLLAVEMVPSDHFKVLAEYFSRQAPMPVPTYGRLSFRTMTVYVPYYQVSQDFDSFVSGKTLFQGVVPSNRFIKMDDYASWFYANPDVTEVTVSAVEYDSQDGYIRLSSDDSIVKSYDWAYLDSNEVKHCMKFGETMRYHVKILNCLGYALPSNVNLKTTSVWYTQIRPKLLTALPLLAFAKAYNDYMSQSQLYNTSALTYLLRSVKDDKTYTAGYNSTNHTLTVGGMNLIFNNIYVCYENDYFTSAWQYPHQPIQSINERTAFDVLNSGTVNYVPNEGASFQETPGGPIYALSNLALQVIRSASDYIRRNMYSGSRPLASIFARFGIKPEDYKFTYSHLIDYSKQQIQVGDVTATAQSQSVPLGDYAGKGIMGDNNQFEYKSSDFGMLFVIGWYTVTPFNSFGFSHHVLRNNPLDYFTPEFDGVGPQPISAGELFTSPFDPSDTTMNDYSVFGFTERYNDYRFGRDMITGEFRDYHADSPMNAWHTGRILTDLRASGTMVAQSGPIVRQPQTDSEYNRIFNLTDANEDKFYLTARFKFLKAVRPMLSLNQVPQLPEGNLLVPRNGNMIS